MKYYTFSSCDIDRNIPDICAYDYLLHFRNDYLDLSHDNACNNNREDRLCAQGPEL